MNRIPQSIVLETVTPEIAKRYLESNQRNYRRLNPKVVARYARLMKDRKWKDEHHQGIAFDWFGNLGDGQHRLSAIVESGVSVVMWVHRGCDPSKFLVTDSGRGRSNADRVHFLNFRDDVDARLATSVARRMLMGLSHSVKEELVPEFALAHENLIGTFLLELRHARPQRCAVIAAFCNASFDYPETKVLECAKRYASGVHEGIDDPIRVLDRTVSRLDAVEARTAPLYAYAVTAIRAAAEGRKLTRLLAAGRDFSTPRVARLKETRPRVTQVDGATTTVAAG